MRERERRERKKETSGTRNAWPPTADSSSHRAETPRDLTEVCEGLGWLSFLAGRSRKGLVFIILYFFNRGLDVLEMTDPERNALLDDEKSPSNNSGCDEDNACSSFTQCRVYKRRWYILFVFTMTSIVSNMMWNTWGPIQRPCRLVFGWERWTVLLLSSLGAIGPILGAFPSTWLMDSRGEPLGLKILHIYY